MNPIIERIRDKLIEDRTLRGPELIDTRKPTHGNCCTCQKCGHWHDECVCEHNDLLGFLIQLDSECEVPA